MVFWVLVSMMVKLGLGLNKVNMKEEIRTLIHKIEYCKTYLATLEPIRECLYVERNKFDPTGWVELEFDITTEIAETKALLDSTRQRLRELGIY